MPVVEQHLPFSTAQRFHTAVADGIVDWERTCSESQFTDAGRSKAKSVRIAGTMPDDAKRALLGWHPMQLPD